MGLFNKKTSDKNAYEQKESKIKNRFNNIYVDNEKSEISPKNEQVSSSQERIISNSNNSDTSKDIRIGEEETQLLIFKKCAELLQNDVDSISIEDSDYEYISLDLTLKEQKKVFQEEKEQLDNFKIDKSFNEVKEKLNKLMPLCKPNIIRSVPYFRHLGLESIVQTFYTEISKFDCEFNKALENANRGYYTANTGLIGEEKVSKELFIYRDRIKYIDGVRLVEGEDSVESDFIVASSTGVFCIEVKNYSAHAKGSKITISKDGLWSRNDADGADIPIGDITQQVYRHIGITQRILNEQLKQVYGNDFPYIPIMPIIVIANNMIEIDNFSDVPVMRISNMYHHISKYPSERVLEKEYWIKIMDILASLNKGAKAYSITEYADTLTEIKEKLIKKGSKFLKIEKALNIEQNLMNIIFSNNSCLVEKFKLFNETMEEKMNRIGEREITILRAYIERMYPKYGIERDVYESLIKYYLNVNDIGELSFNAYNMVSEAFKEELRTQ
jgi:hypothetical protein